MVEGVPVQDLPIEETDLGPMPCVPFGRGFALPQPNSSGSDPEIHIGVVDGMAGCVKIVARSRLLTASTLRSLTTRSNVDSPHDATLPPPGPIGEIVRGMVTETAVRVVRTVEGEVIGVHSFSTDNVLATIEERTIDIATELSDAERSRRGRKPLTDKHLKEVAEVYREAISQRRSTQRTIAEKWTIQYATARRWVAIARERGFLGPAPGRRQAGERP
jgi:hypothetical protein